MVAFMKKKFYFLTLLMCICLCSCNNESIYLDNGEKNLSNDNFGQVYIPIEYSGITDLSNGKATIFDFTDEDTISYYLFDISSNSMKKIGEITDFIVGKNDTVLTENKMYVSAGTGQIENLDTELYEFDLKSGTVKILSSEKLYQTLVSSKILGSNVISLKGDLDDDMKTGRTYIELLNEISLQTYRLVEKKINIDTALGESIEAFDSYNNQLFALIAKYEENRTTHFIEKYNSKGELIKVIDCSNIYNYLEGQNILNFYFYNDFVFVSNLSGSSIIGKIENNQLDIILKGNYEYRLEPTISNSDKNRNTAIFFLRDYKYLFLLNINTNSINCYDISKENYEHLRYCYIDNENLLYSLKSSEGDEQLFYESIQWLNKNRIVKTVFIDDNINNIEDILNLLH